MQRRSFCKRSCTPLLPRFWLGTGQKQARHLTRLVRLGDGAGVRMYLTNVCDPQVISLGDVAQLYVRRWDIEMAFRLLKEYLGMSHWWSSKQELILVQIWVVLILSQIVYALRERIATAANREPFEVSMPRHGGTAAPTLQQLWALIRATYPGCSTSAGA